MPDDGLGGFVMSDKARRHVFLELMAGAATLERIVKKQRLIRPMAERAANELVTRGLVAKKGEDLALTESGEVIARELKGGDMFR